MSSSLRCFSSQSVSTSASGCAYCVGCVAIRQEISGCFSARARDFTFAAHHQRRLSILAYVARQPRRREQLLELAPAFLRLRGRAAALLDVTAHHVFAKIVVDDVAAVFLDELCPLLRLLLIHERVFFQPCRGR